MTDHSERGDLHEIGLFKDGEGEQGVAEVHHGFPCFGVSRVAVLFCLVIIFSTVTNVLTTVAVVGSSKELKLSDDGLLIAADSKNKNAVATLSTGLTFQFEVQNDPNMEPFPYSCVEVEAAIDLWRAVSHGIPTNVVLQQKDAEIGVTMTFQGSSKNESTACLATMDYRQEQKLCIDFVSNRCDSAYPRSSEKESQAPVITEQTIFGPNYRRVLFEHGNENRRHEPVGAIRGDGGDGHHRRTQESNEYICADYGGMGCFYSKNISIVFVGGG